MLKFGKLGKIFRNSRILWGGPKSDRLWNWNKSENIRPENQFKVGSHHPISIQLTLKIFVCVMKFVVVHTIQFLHPFISWRARKTLREFHAYFTAARPSCGGHFVKIFSKIERGKIKDWRFFWSNWMKIEHVLFSSNTQKLQETCQKLAFTRPIVVWKSGPKNNWTQKLDSVNWPLDRVIIEQVWKILDQQDKGRQKRDNRLLKWNLSHLLENDSVWKIKSSAE